MPEITEDEMKRFESLREGRALRVERSAGGYWAARMRGLTTYGATRDEAVQRLTEAFKFFIETSYRRMEEEV